MQQNILTKNKISNLHFCLIVGYFFLSVFITPVAVLLNRIFGGGYIYFSVIPDVLIIAGLLINLKNIKLKFFKTIDWLIAAYLVLTLVYCLIDFLSGAQLISVGQGLLTVSRLGFVYFAVKEINFSKSQITHSKKMLTLALSLIVIFAIAQLVWPGLLKLIGYQYSPVKPISTVDGTSLLRVQSSLRGPNPLGAFLLIPLSFIMFKIKDTLRSKGLMTLSVASLLSLIATWSRSAWLGFILIFLFWLKDKIKLGKKVLTWAGAASLCLIMLGFFYTKTDSFKTIFLHDKPGVGGATTSDQDRIESYKNSLSLIAEKPLGIGISNAGPASVRSNKGVNIVENYYLQIALQLGWAGLAILIMVFLTVLLILIKTRDDYGKALLASFLGLSLVGTMQPVWVDVSVVVWWWSLFALWLHNIKKDMI